jgi:hypothetical protein
MIGGLVEFDDLRKLSRLGDNAKLATVERWAQRVGIRYQYDGRGGIWTTTDALNAALGLNVAQSDDAAPYDVGMF